MFRHCVAFILFIVCVLGVTGRSRAQSKPTAGVEKILTWLPENTETVMVATRPGHLGPNPSRSSLAGGVTDLLSIGLPDERDSSWSVSFQFAVDGTRNYRAPKALGLWPYEGCKILSITPKESVRLEALAKRRAAWTGTVSSKFAYVIRGRIEEDTWTWYLVFSDGFLFCATDKSYLAEVLSRRNESHSGRALPETLLQWKYIDRSAPFWAVRQFTPASNHAWGGANMEDDRLIGYAISTDKDQRRLTVISMSNSPDGFDKSTKLWGGFMKKEGRTSPLEMTKVDEQTTRIVLDFQSPQGGVAMLLILDALGHAVFI